MNLPKAVLFSLVFAAQLPTAYALSSATSHVSMIKLATLQVSGMDTDVLYADQSHGELPFSTCLQTSGAPVPFRISASSLHGHTGFTATDNALQSRIRYDVTWSNGSSQFRLRDSTDITEVQLTDKGIGCNFHTLVIDLDDQMFESAAMESHTDTLSLIFIIE